MARRSISDSLKASREDYMNKLKDKVADLKTNKYYNENAKLNWLGRMAANAEAQGHGTLFNIGQKNKKAVQINNEIAELMRQIYEGDDSHTDKFAQNTTLLGRGGNDASRYNMGLNGNIANGAPSAFTNSYNTKSNNYWGGPTTTPMKNSTFSDFQRGAAHQSDAVTNALMASLGNFNNK